MQPPSNEPIEPTDPNTESQPPKAAMLPPGPPLPLLDLTPAVAETEEPVHEDPVKERTVRSVKGRLMRGNRPYQITPWPPPNIKDLNLKQDGRIGQTVGERFTVNQRLARGGMGTIYIGTDRTNHQEVAIKFLEHRLADDSEEAETRFQAEAQIISSLKNPRILHAMDHGRTERNELYIVTELLHGMPLNRALDRMVRLNQRRVMRMMRDICEALSEAHTQGIIHRDLTPGNIFIERFGEDDEATRVLDFGIAKFTRNCSVVTSNGRASTQTGAVLGTIGYMAPEQASNKNVTAQSDLYSLGMLAYKCLTGRLPYDVGGWAILAAPLFTAPRPIAKVAPDVDIHPSLATLIMQLIAKDPYDRPIDADEVRMRLEKILDHVTHAPAPPRVSPLPRKPPRRPWWSVLTRFITVS